MWPIAADGVAWSVSLSVSVTTMNCTKMAEPFEMLFGIWTQLGPMNHVLGAVHIGATWRIQLNHLYAVAMLL